MHNISITIISSYSKVNVRITSGDTYCYCNSIGVVTDLIDAWLILLFYKWNLVDFLSSLSLRNQPLLTRVRRQVAVNCPRLPLRDSNLRLHDCKDATLIRHWEYLVFNSAWARRLLNSTTFHLLNSTKFCQMAEVTNYDFLCPAWKIAISLFTASVLAAGSTSLHSLFLSFYLLLSLPT